MMGKKKKKKGETKERGLAEEECGEIDPHPFVRDGTAHKQGLHTREVCGQVSDPVAHGSRRNVQERVCLSSSSHP